MTQRIIEPVFLDCLRFGNNVPYVFHSNASLAHLGCGMLREFDVNRFMGHDLVDQVRLVIWFIWLIWFLWFIWLQREKGQGETGEKGSPASSYRLDQVSDHPADLSGLSRSSR